MPKKSQRRASQYARASGRGRKPRPVRHTGEVDASGDAEIQPQRVLNPPARTGRSRLVDYRLLLGDLRGILLVSLVVFGILAALTILLPR